MPTFKKTKPCDNCPYRMDAPLRHWDVEEFKKLREMEASELGTVYGCHKNDGSTCIGWLIDQDKRFFPSIMLRLSLSRNNITREYLDTLSCDSELFPSVEEMCRANYPEEFL